jgi:hypothetical protein
LKTFTLAAALFLPLTIHMPAAAADDKITPPDVPTELQISDGTKPFLVGHAYGTQNYLCLPSTTGVAWTLFGPQATLFDVDGDQLITHFLSPNPEESGVPRATWQHSRDSSSVWALATVIYTKPPVAPSAIPWLRLDVVGSQYGPQWGDKLTTTKHILRINTAGGVAPSTGCTAPGDIGKRAFVPYTTDYIFYR